MGATTGVAIWAGRHAISCAFGTEAGHANLLVMGIADPRSMWLINLPLKTLDLVLNRGRLDKTHSIFVIMKMKFIRAMWGLIDRLSFRLGLLFFILPVVVHL